MTKTHCLTVPSCVRRQAETNMHYTDLQANEISYCNSSQTLEPHRAKDKRGPEINALIAEQNAFVNCWTCIQILLDARGPDFVSRGSDLPDPGVASRFEATKLHRNNKVLYPDHFVIPRIIMAVKSGSQLRRTERPQARRKHEFYTGADYHRTQKIIKSQ